ncbi:MAG: hypothetical protein QOE41_534 [Mycobacterium sp.]|nr:hypothetical protein [Mycobacterium sp.]MDT5131223.1 hypothetical protein [Mycobacterium sp.]
MANALAAKGQSCLPGCATTAQLIPLALPSAQSELAAALRSPGVAAAAAQPVDALGVVVERAAGVGEDEHRRVAAVCRREVVDRLTAFPARSQSAGVLNSPPIIITTGSFGGGSLAYHAAGR